MFVKIVYHSLLKLSIGELNIRMLGTNYGKARGIAFFYFFFYSLCCFFFAKAAIHGDKQIENDIDAFVPTGHAEIVDGVSAIHAFRAFFR